MKCKEHAAEGGPAGAHKSAAIDAHANPMSARKAARRALLLFTPIDIKPGRDWGYPSLARELATAWKYNIAIQLCKWAAAARPPREGAGAASLRIKLTYQPPPCDRAAGPCGAQR